MKRSIYATLGIGLVVFEMTVASPAFAWGDQGHKVVALVADHYLKPAVRQKIKAMLAQDTSGLTPSTSIADEATWADRFRDSDRNTTKIRYDLTRNWHFVDIEIAGADIDAACFGHPASEPNASDGPAEACVVDKINSFAAELKEPTTSATERRAALQFLLHFVGDLHQPLHSSNDHDKGGNDKKVKAAGVPSGSLHHYWDAVFVANLGSVPQKIAGQLVKTTTSGQIKAWSKGDAESWALQSLQVSKLRAYGGLGVPDASGKFMLSATYVTEANKTVARQLARAGVRLAKLLNDSLS